MKIQTSDPDISTIYNRIKDEVIDLQPDFQRDLVWNISKKQMLIDTILRGWQFPPIFLVAPPLCERLDVLDGQQRLNAIYEFMEGNFSVNGNIEPKHPSIEALNGLYFHQLPPDVRSRFGRTSFRVCELYDYKEDEPYELFFRLNQGSVLTPAEKRNTLYGPTREKVKCLVMLMNERGLNIDKIGFNNNRLAYEDVIARLLYAIEVRSLAKKITDQFLIDMYRGGLNLSAATFDTAHMAIEQLARLLDKKIKLSKPTLFSLLLFLSLDQVNKEFIYNFDNLRRNGSTSDRSLEFFIDIFQEKASTSVNDAVPVQLRLLAMYLIGIAFGCHFNSATGAKARNIFDRLSKSELWSEEILVELMNAEQWSNL